jgi:CDP-paratose 2-epimerase
LNPHPFNIINTRPVLITGGAGFIGTNLAERFLSNNQPVIVYDNLSRTGVERNLKALSRRFGSLVQVSVSDVRDVSAINRAVTSASQVFHFASQVAVTKSLLNPLIDFEVNARGTLNILEALRSLEYPPPLVFTSTNKVYGPLTNLKLVQKGTRYEFDDNKSRFSGINESYPLDFHSPYGCSKGAADQYVLDYSRTFNIPAVVFRMSCIYGPHQIGTEDQGWLSHFLLKAIEGKPITIYGDGMQLRDVLHVNDLIVAFDSVTDNLERVTGQAFNIGGGPANTIRLLELIDIINKLTGKNCVVDYEEPRMADQRYYVSDLRKFQALTGWVPRINVLDGVTSLYNYLCESKLNSA